MSKYPALREELAAEFADLEIHSFASFSFRGISHMTSTGAAANYSTLQESLRNVLYGFCYTRNYETSESTIANPGLLSQLMQANPAIDRWDPGWKIYQTGSDGRILVQKGERSRAAVQGEYATSKPPGRLPQAGDVVNLRVHPGSADIQQGFYFAFGTTLFDQFDDSALLRFYFNVTACGAPQLLHFVTKELNRFQVPFSYKTLTASESYLRADAAVLYCAKRYHRIVTDILATLPAEICSNLRTQSPMFTKSLLPGIGLAEEPGTGESFGMHRCRLVAEGLLDAWFSGEQTPSARLQAVEKRFSASGIQLAQPYLNAGSVDLFDLVSLESIES